MKSPEINQVVMKAGYIIGGLILERIPQVLEQSRFISSLEDQTFWHGVATGVFLGVRIVGICIFAYGIAYYDVKKTDGSDVPKN